MSVTLVISWPLAKLTDLSSIAINTGGGGGAPSCALAAETLIAKTAINSPMARKIAFLPLHFRLICVPPPVLQRLH